MRYIITLLTIVILSNILIAQQHINFHLDGSIDSYQLNESDSLYFNDNHSTLYFYNDGNIIEHAISDVDSITFSNDIDNNVYIEYFESSVNIDNPLSNNGINIQVEGANVTITSTSTTEEINYICSGSTTNGMLKIYSDVKFNLLLDDLDITNPVGPAINIQSSKRAFINSTPGSNNMLKDGANYNAPVVIDGEEEDQKAALFSEGKIKFIGSGSLVVQGLGEDQHGIRSDKKLSVLEGNLTIASSAKDGIHADGFVMDGGTLNVTSVGDGIDADEDQIEISCGLIIINSTSDDVNGIVCDSTLTISGGDITLNISGDQSKGLKCEMEMMLNGGTIHGIGAGDVVLEEDDLGYDPSYCSLIKAEADLWIDGATLDFVTAGEASRAISCEGNLTIQSGSISIVSSGDGDTYTNAEGEDDAYYGVCMKIDGDLSIYGGELSMSNAGSGGKGISAKGDIIYGDGSSVPDLEIIASGQSITITSGGNGGPGSNNGDYDEPKAMKSDGTITINSGSIQISSADDAIKADESITINNGTIEILSSVEGLEAPFVTVNDGTITIAATDDGINATMGEEVMNDDGSLINVNGGTITVNMSGNDVDAMDSNGDITILGGTVYLNFPTQGPSSGLDANGTVTIDPNATVYENGIEI